MYVQLHAEHVILDVLYWLHLIEKVEEKIK